MYSRLALTDTCAEATGVDCDLCRGYRRSLAPVQRLPKLTGTCAEATGADRLLCRGYRS